jgi:hypothetical protein
MFFGVVPLFSKPRLRREPSTTTAIVVVAIAVGVGGIVAVGDLHVRGIVVPRTAPKASASYCLPVFGSVSGELPQAAHLRDWLLFTPLLWGRTVAAGLREAAV